MTARRQLMLCAEFLKHIDADTPIRFLIAECEAPATVMGAIYLARLYGVDTRLDISPLFETPEAIEHGGRFMERLLSVKEFVDFVRARGRLAVQIGFSDSGRFMGQVAANLAIERLQILLARALAKQNVRDVEVVIFNTHGEAMGRGGYPGGIEQRFDYLMTPWARARYARERLAVNAESSFQGGDGFLHFETDGLARATIAALIKWSFAEPEADASDRYYSDINYSWDFYRSIQTWQEGLFEDADYHVAISAFAPNLLFTTGSRKLRRQSGTATSGPRSLRAIPHNAILQQLAAPANVFGGAGRAAGGEPERLVDHAQGSARMKEVLGLIRHARDLTSLSVVRAYATLFDASFWISRAAGESDLKRAAPCEEIAAHLADQKTPTAIHRLANLFAADLAKLDRVLSEIERGDGAPPPEEQRRAMHALHAIRQAMIMKAFVLVAGLPSFSSRHDVSRALVFGLALQLKFDELADLLDLIFPATDAGAAAFSAIEEEEDAGEGVRGYPEIHANVVEPLRAIHRAIREIGVGLSHFYGAYG
jgi:phosphoenolpyruvate carboxylase